MMPFEEVAIPQALEEGAWVRVLNIQELRGVEEDSPEEVVIDLELVEVGPRNTPSRTTVVRVTVDCCFRWREAAAAQTAVDEQGRR